MISLLESKLFYGETVRRNNHASFTQVRSRSHISEALDLDRPSSESEAEDGLTERALERLAEVYREDVEPMAETYKFDRMSNRHFGEDGNGDICQCTSRERSFPTYFFNKETCFLPEVIPWAMFASKLGPQYENHIALTIFACHVPPPPSQRSWPSRWWC